MNNHTHRPLGAGHDHLSAMPAEILHEIFKHVLQTPSQQVLPNPLSQISSGIAPHVSNLLLKNCTMQLECRHEHSPHFWATSLYRSSAKGDILRSPDLPTIKGSNARWSKFRQLWKHVEMLKGVDSLYIKLNHAVAFTILLHRDQPPTITSHTRRRPGFQPDLRHWKEPARCSVEWVELFIEDMRNQCTEYWRPGTRVDDDRDVHAGVMHEMDLRQPWPGHPVLLRQIDRSVAVPKILSLDQRESLKYTFYGQKWVEERRFRKNREVLYEYRAGCFKVWVGEQMREKAEDFKRLVRMEEGHGAYHSKALRRHSF